NFHLYMRDLNFLGIPTINLVIPEYSVGFLALKNYSTPEIEDFKLKLISSFSLIEDDDLEILSKPEFILHVSMNDSIEQFLNIEVASLERISSWKFLGLLAYMFGYEDIAHKYLLQSEITPSKVEKLLLNLKKDNFLKQYSSLSKIIPNCFNFCESCIFANQCKHFLLKNYEKNLFKKYVNYFRFLNP
ncbi:MAG: hypothetical protein ACTSRZ_18410, partial [Promethearchaeota archaeon]